MNSQAARDISYASAAKSNAGKALIRSIENMTGRIGLIKRARNYEQEIAAGKNFWEVMVSKYRLELDLLSGSLDNIPQSGSVIVVCNHPYGILDGLMLGYILAKRRGDFRIIANNVFTRAEDINKIILPISFDETREAGAKNVQTRKNAIKYLGEGGCVGIFPGGTVSTALRPFGRAMDPSWKKFTARLIIKSGASVIPIYFDGSNSRLFQIARHFNYNFSMGLMIREFRRRTDDKVSVAIGEQIENSAIKAYMSHPGSLMDLLRRRTYELSPNKNTHNFEMGYDFDN